MFKKSQVSIFSIIGLAIVILISLILFLSTEKSKAPFRESTSFSSNSINLFDIYANSCMEESFKSLFVEYGFSFEETEERLPGEFINCLNKAEIPELEILMNEELASAHLIKSEKLIYVEVYLPTKLNSENMQKDIITYTYAFSLLNSETVSIDSFGKVSTDTKVTSSDGKAIIYLGEGNELQDSEGNRLSKIAVETYDSDNNVLVFGNFLYDFTPSGMKAEDMFILEIGYDENWIDEENELNLKIMNLDEKTGYWKVMPSLVDTERNIVRALVNHFSVYALGEYAMTSPLFADFETGSSRAYLLEEDIESDITTTATRIVTRTGEETPTICGEPKTNTKYMFGFDDFFEVLPYSNGLELSGCLSEGDSHMYLIENLPIPNNNLRLSELQNNGNVEVYRSIYNNQMYVQFNGQGEYRYVFTEGALYEDIIDVPFSFTPYITYCYDDDGYTEKNNYVHLGTDMSTGKVKTACDATLFDIWNYEYYVGDKCDHMINTAPDRYEFLNGGVYKRYQVGLPPQYKLDVSEPVSYTGKQGIFVDDTSAYHYGNTVVLECKQTIGGKKIQIFYFHLQAPDNFLIRFDGDGAGGYSVDPAYPKMCPGDYLGNDVYFADAGASGAAKGAHLHFEIRFGYPASNGIIPRQYAVNPAKLEEVYGLLTDEFVEVINKPSTGGHQASCNEPVYSIANIDEQYWIN